MTVAVVPVVAERFITMPPATGDGPCRVAGKGEYPLRPVVVPAAIGVVIGLDGREQAEQLLPSRCLVDTAVPYTGVQEVERAERVFRHRFVLHAGGNFCDSCIRWSQSHAGNADDEESRQHPGCTSAHGNGPETFSDTFR